MTVRDDRGERRHYVSSDGASASCTCGWYTGFVLLDRNLRRRIRAHLLHAKLEREANR